MDEQNSKVLTFNSNRRFGVELEILAFDKKNRPTEEKMPKGTDYVVNLVKKNVEENVESRAYEHTKDNSCWVIKPDSSCGLEICTPPLKGWKGIKKVCQVVEAFGKDPKIEVDKRCSVHVHVEVSDLSEEQIGTVIAYWIKCEPIFMDLVPQIRKRNRYCQLMGMTNLFNPESTYTARNLINKVGEVKYFSMNTNQLKDGKRNTIEFRIIEGEGCKNPYLIKNWLRLLLHFVEITSNMQMPPPYKSNDQWSSLLWLDTRDVFKLLGFEIDQFNLSKGLTQTRDWMVARLLQYMYPDIEQGPRCRAYKELLEYIEDLSKKGYYLNKEENLLPKNLEESLYEESLRF
jgi:hypothetical protein